MGCVPPVLILQPNVAYTGSEAGSPLRAHAFNNFEREDAKMITLAMKTIPNQRALSNDLSKQREPIDWLNLN